MLSKITRISCNKCPAAAPDQKGTVFECYSGDQIGRDINTTSSNLISGTGCFSSHEANFLNFAYIYCERGHGSAIALAKSRMNLTTKDPILALSTFINNTCEKEELFVTNYSLVIENSVFLHNKITKRAGHQASEEAPKKKWSMDMPTSNTKVEKNVLTNAIYKNCMFDSVEKIDATYLDCNIGSSGKTIAISEPEKPRMIRSSPVKKSGKVSMKVVLLGPIFVAASLLAMTSYRSTRVRGAMLNRVGEFERL